MWIARKPTPQEATPSENTQPFPTPSPNIIPTNHSLLPQQVEQLARVITQYCPISDTLSMQTLLESPNTQLKKFRESVFLGEIVEGKRRGAGLMSYVNGRVYEGQWLNNFKHGKGYQKFSNSSVYKGEYVNGKPQGCGNYEWENGQLYEGQWFNGLKHGSGIWRGSKGDSYIGQWREGRADGYGVHTWVNGDRYEGQFKDCLKHGEGVEHFANGDSYKGNYEVGKPSGYGEYYWSSASFFKGQFNAGLRCGQGLWKKGAGRSDKYQGGWVSDKKQGYGVFTWADGSVYKGQFVNDFKEGEGEMYSADGSVFKGLWVADRPLQDPDNSCEHDEDCQLFMPQHYQDQAFHVQQLPQKPVYQQPPYLDNQHPYLKPGSRNIRPRTFTRNTARSELRSRGQSPGKRPSAMGGLVKKMSAGTVRGKSELGGGKREKPMSSSFFLYKINGEAVAKNLDSVPARQSRTSGGTRRQRPQGDQESKYFARSKMGSFSQFQ